MKSNEIRETWRGHLVNSLKNRYGLAEEQAQLKADSFLQWIQKSSAATKLGFPVRHVKRSAAR
jgi:hypothetical protein